LRSALLLLLAGGFFLRGFLGSFFGHRFIAPYCVGFGLKNSPRLIAVRELYPFKSTRRRKRATQLRHKNTIPFFGKFRAEFFLP
jgi:hypothetical protein